MGVKLLIETTAAFEGARTHVLKTSADYESDALATGHATPPAITLTEHYKQVLETTCPTSVFSITHAHKLNVHH